MKIVWEGTIDNRLHIKVRHGFWPFCKYVWYYNKYYYNKYSANFSTKEVGWKYLADDDPAIHINKFFTRQENKKDKELDKKLAKEKIKAAEAAMRRANEDCLAGQS